MLNLRRLSTGGGLFETEKMLSPENDTFKPILTHVVVVLLLSVLLQSPQILLGQRLLFYGHPIEAGVAAAPAVGGSAVAVAWGLAQLVEKVQ